MSRSDQLETHRLAHEKDDVDFDAKAHHHTIGDGPYQAASGAKLKALIAAVEALGVIADAAITPAELAAALADYELTIDDSGWINLGSAYHADWTDLGTVSSVPYRRGQYKKRAGRVYLVGSVKRTTGATLTPCTLPVGYRPSAAIIRECNRNGAYGQLVITTDGVVTVSATVTNQALSFDISFDVNENT